MQYLNQCPPWVAVLFALVSIGIAIWTKVNDTKHLKDKVKWICGKLEKFEKEQNTQGNRLTAIETTLKERK